MHILICDPDKAIMEGPKNMHVHVYTCIHARIYICAGRLPGVLGGCWGVLGGCRGVHIISQAGHGAQRVTIIGRTRLPST